MSMRSVIKSWITPRKIVLIIWVFFLISCLGFIILNPHLREPREIAIFLERFNNYILLVYFILSILRGFTLFPSTPLVIAGTILFPNNLFLVLFISMVGIIFSSSMVYFFSDYLGFSEYFKKHSHQKIQQIKAKLETKKGFLFVFLWSFMPILPTDLICYIAGTIKMNFKKFLLAMICGELIICSIYVFVPAHIFDFRLPFAP